MRNIVRVLRIPHGGKADEDGREVGDDWLLATLGQDMAGATYYLTTDHVNGSDLPEALDNTKKCAELIAALVNRAWRAERGPASPELPAFLDVVAATGCYCDRDADAACVCYPGVLERVAKAVAAAGPEDEARRWLTDARGALLEFAGIEEAP